MASSVFKTLTFAEAMSALAGGGAEGTAGRGSGSDPCYCGYHHDDMDRYFEDDGDEDSRGGYESGAEDEYAAAEAELSAIEQNLTSVIDAPEFQPLEDLLKPIKMEDFMALDCGWVKREQELRAARMTALEDVWLLEMLGNGRKEKLMEEMKKKVATATSRMHLWVPLDYFNSSTWFSEGEYTDTDGTVYESVEAFVKVKGYHETVRTMFAIDKTWAHAEMEKYMLLTKSAARKRLAAAFDPLLFYVRIHTQNLEMEQPNVWQHAVTLEYWPNGVPARLREE